MHYNKVRMGTKIFYRGLGSYDNTSMFLSKTVKLKNVSISYCYEIVFGHSEEKRIFIPIRNT